MISVVCIVISQSTNFYLLDVENILFVNIVDKRYMAHFPNSSEGLSLSKNLFSKHWLIEQQEFVHPFQGIVHII